MAALIAVSICGNLWVMTFTAARVKQDRAKEGILPYSLYIATSYTTPYGFWQKWTKKDNVAGEHFEQAPTLAFALHWFTSVLLIAVTAPFIDPRKSYATLVSLYSYTIILVLGCWVSVGLILVKLQQSRWQWQQSRRYRPWLSPMHAIIYAVATTWLLVSSFLPPGHGSPFHESATGLPWYVVPTIGITSPLWGILWYCGILTHQARIGRHLVVSREAYWEQDPDDPNEYVERAEIIDHAWPITSRGEMSEEFDLESRTGHGASGIHRTSRTLDEEVEEAYRRSSDRGGPVRGARRLSDSFDS